MSDNSVKTQNKFQCEFCDKAFSRETSLAVHLCEPKRRRQARGERGVELGFQAYLRFYEMAQGSSKMRSWEDFETSAYYRAFVKWGHYCVNTRAIAPERWLAWLLKNNKKIDRWASDTIYTEYLLDHLRVEAAEDALARAMEWAIDWEERNGHPANDCLRFGNSNLICHAVTTGRISAWILYNCESGQKFLSELDSTQIAMIWPYIDSDTWQRKFRDYPADKAYVEELLSKARW